MSPRAALWFLSPLFVVAASTGCEAFESLEGDQSRVHIFATHHATPEDGVFPDRGDEDRARIFDNDTGWEIVLSESYVTITGTQLVGCDGTIRPIDLFWGPCPEDMTLRDLETVTVSGARVPAGDYCGLQVQYGPYVLPEPTEDSRHIVPENESMQGSSIFLRGAARRNGESIPFELVSEATAVVELDLSELEGPGAPMRVERAEEFPKELTVTKTYDRYFDGIDFSNYDPAELEARLTDILVAQTRVVDGTVVVASRQTGQ